MHPRALDAYPELEPAVPRSSRAAERRRDGSSALRALPERDAPEPAARRRRPLDVRPLDPRDVEPHLADRPQVSDHVRDACTIIGEHDDVAPLEAVDGTGAWDDQGIAAAGPA